MGLVAAFDYGMSKGLSNWGIEERTPSRVPNNGQRITWPEVGPSSSNEANARSHLINEYKQINQDYSGTDGLVRRQLSS